MSIADELTEPYVVLPEPVRPRARRHTVQPLTWIVSAAVMPVLLYDVWQTVQDVNHRHAAAAAANVTVSLSSTAGTRLN